MKNLTPILEAYKLNTSTTQTETFGGGLINHTWRVTDGSSSQYILQRINTAVFKKPQAIADNIRLCSNYLSLNYPDYLFVSPIQNTHGQEMTIHEGDYYRLFPFVEGSHAKVVATRAEHGYEAARQFGRFTHHLQGLEATSLQVTIPDFHDLGLRYEQLLSALRTGNSKRIAQSKKWIEKALLHKDIVEVYQHLKAKKLLRQRVTHHDTKISNVLFNKEDKGLCVIDLDTVMPGYFISDVGDMMRTYLAPTSEDETDMDKVEPRRAYYDAIKEGYLSEMSDALSLAEKEHFDFAARYMVYMQAIRFLADYVNKDVYYGAKYPEHNLHRAMNQFVLLERL